jgi:hypothetical protein
MQTAAALAACLGASSRVATAQSQQTAHPTRMWSLLLGPCEQLSHDTRCLVATMAASMTAGVFDQSGPKPGQIINLVRLGTRHVAAVQQQQSAWTLQAC